MAATTKKAVEAATTEGPDATPSLARASESTDPAVHQLMAELQSAQMNGDADKAAALVEQLAKLGFE